MQRAQTSELKGDVLQEFLGRGSAVDPKIAETAASVILRVRRDGDAALRALADELDGVSSSVLRVSPDDIDAAAEACAPDVREAIRSAARAIYRFHRPQRIKRYQVSAGSSSRLSQEVLPLESAGLYVPGGRAAYPSTVLMSAIPARVAGVPRIVCVTPPRDDGLDPTVAAALAEVGVEEVYAVGGAQAIAALAYGTETIAPVDKIVGPGNAYVTAAKRQVFGDVDIDGVAGPSEVLVVADDTANPEWVAAELIAQAEHDPDACSVAVATDSATADAIERAVSAQASQTPRLEIVEAALAARGGIVVAADRLDAVEFANRVGPEHLVLMIRSPREVLRHVRAAGCVFLGSHSPVALGDYAAGPNHVLPTGGAARFGSPLGVYDFLHRLNVVEFTAADLARRAETVTTLADHEGLHAHAHSVRLRSKKGSA